MIGPRTCYYVTVYCLFQQKGSEFVFSGSVSSRSTSQWEVWCYTETLSTFCIHDKENKAFQFISQNIKLYLNK